MIITATDFAEAIKVQEILYALPESHASVISFGPIELETEVPREDTTTD
jgi:hypothetical protein